MSPALAGVRVVTPEGVLDPGWVALADGRITAVGAGRPEGDALDLGGAWLLPGFVDLHMHGGGGFDVTASAEALAGAVAFHRAHGTTRTLVSLVAQPVDDLCEQLAFVAGAGVVGAHLEGPFLSVARCGAQNPAYLVPPDLGALDRLLAAGPVRMMTVAPELPGAADVIRRLVEHGAIAALGHSDSGYEAAIAGFDAGAGLVTHLGNGMPPMQQREPGLIGAALDRRVPCEVIGDGAHVHPALLRILGDRLVLITDAIAAAGAPDGRYALGGQDVVVADGVARVEATGSLAGSTLTMEAAVRRAVQVSGLSVPAAAHAAATLPARLLGQPCGAIAAGLDADLVVLDDDLRVTRVMIGGRWRT